MNRFELFDLSGEVAIVTGGNGWIGEAIAEGLGTAGATVVLANRDASSAEQVVTRLDASGISAAHVPFDQAEDGGAESLVQQTIDRFGAVDVLVNNAAAWPMRSRNGPVSDFQTSMRINAAGLFDISRAAANAMQTRGSGSIVTIGSVFGVVGPDLSIYDSEDDSVCLPDYFFHKGGSMQLTRWLAAVYGPSGIRSNYLAVGPIAKNRDSRIEQAFAERTPLRRIGRRQDVVGPVVFLASAASSYVNGSTLVADGGYSSI